LLRLLVVDLDDDDDRQGDHLIVLGLDVARNIDALEFQVDIVSDFLEERDDHVEPCADGAVVATESLDHAYLLLADDLDRHRHEDDDEDHQQHEQEVGEDSAEEISDASHEGFTWCCLRILHAVVRVVVAVGADALFARHVETSRLCALTSVG